MVDATTGSSTCATPGIGRRRLLVIADLRHASPRWPALLGGLILRGWEVTVVTAPLAGDAAHVLAFPKAFASNAKIIETGPTSDILEPLRRLLWFAGLKRKVSLTEQVKGKLASATARGGFNRIFQFALAILGWPDLQAPWKRPALRVAEALLAQEHFSALISSSPYATSHAVAAELKHRHPSLRWVADFRDLWADNHNYSGPAWRQAVDRQWERRMLRNVDAITTPTSTWSAHLQSVHRKPAACIPNGFVDYNGTPESFPVPTNRFELLYSGIRYPKHQSIMPLLDAIASLRHRGMIDADSFCFRWIGPYDSETALAASRLGIAELIRQEPPVDRMAALHAQRRAHALLFLQWQDPATDWSSSLKLHEYIGSGRPILAVGGFRDSNVSRLLATSGRAAIALSATEVADSLLVWIAQIANAGHIRQPDDWYSTAIKLSGISRGLTDLERILEPAP